MYIELNFEAGKNGKIEAERCFLELARSLPNNLRAEQSSYDGPDGKVVTGTFVAKINCSPEVAIAIAYRLACELDEDCVAVCFYEGKGMLVGPNAAKWGAFNPAFFIRF